MDDRIKVVFVTASEVNYQALRELLPAAAILRDDREGEVERINFIRKPVEIKEFIQRVQTTMTQPRDQG
jgi:CheY-like chemotaxis protein